MRKPYVSKLVLVLMCTMFLVLGVLFASPHNNQKRADGVTWQSSASPHVRLGVRDKLGDLGKYRAVFTVITPDGRHHTKNINVKGSDWGYVFFPADFTAWWQRGADYTWRCQVGDEVIAEGVFKHEYLPADEERVTVP